MLLGAGLILLGVLTLSGVLFAPADAGAEGPQNTGTANVRGSKEPSERSMRGASAAPVLRGATEVDHPKDFAYAAQRETCTKTKRLTDEFKALGLAIDEEIRRGSELSDADEQRIGQEAIAEFERVLGGTLTTAGAIPRYLDAVARPLLHQVKRLGPSYRFYLWEGTDTENAFALPGGHIAVSKPLFDRWVHNEAQLVAVLAHEIGHVDLRHPVAVFESMRAMGIPEKDQLTQMLVHLARLPYSSAQEEASDVYGGEMMHRAGYSLFQAVALWDERAQENPSKASGGGLIDVLLGEAENLLRTHPDSAARACRLKQLAYQMYREEPLSSAYVGTTNKKTLTPMSERTY